MDRATPLAVSEKAGASNKARRRVSRAPRSAGAPEPSAPRPPLARNLVQAPNAANGSGGPSGTGAERLADDLRAYVAAASESLASALPLIALLPDGSSDAERTQAGDRFTRAGQAMAEASAALWQSWAGLVVSPGDSATRTPPG
jgi:hypothetical protein